MKLSPLQLLDYFVAEFHFSLNSKFKPTEGVEKKLEELEATPAVAPIADKPRCWTVSMELKYQPAADTNTPYIFSLTLVGMVEIEEHFPSDRIDQLVKTNGPSILYSIAREIIREQTARGPEGPFVLPTASFVSDPPAAPAAAPTPASLPAPDDSVASATVAKAPKSRRPRSKKTPPAP